MEKEVTLRDLNKAFIAELIKSKLLWIGVVIYISGLLLLKFSTLTAGIVMIIAALIMLNADWISRNKVVKKLRWK